MEHPASRALLSVEGPDAVEFLHRISSQDVEALPVGGAAPACFLNPKGKLVATADLGRTGTGVVIDVHASLAGPLAEYLDMFHFTERLEIRPAGDAVSVEVFGPSSWDSAGLAEVGCAERAGITWFAGGRHGVRWARGHGAPDVVAAWVADAGLDPLDEQLGECLRMASAQVVVGIDTDESTIALEAPVDDHVSTTKGCYTGQEIVARIHTYGHVNRRVVLMRVDAADEIESGASLVELEDGDPVGRLTRSALLPGGERRLAFGYVPRDFAEPGSELRVGTLDGAPALVVAFDG